MRAAQSNQKFGREQPDSNSNQERPHELLINILNELIKLKEEREREKNNQIQSQDDSQEITALVDLPTFLKKKETAQDLEEPSDKITDNNTITFEGNLEAFEQSDIETNDPAEEQTENSQKTKSIVFPDEPRPSEEFFHRGLVNFDESSSEEIKNKNSKDEEHVGVPLKNRPQNLHKSDKIEFYKKLKNLLLQKIAQENRNK